MLLYLCLLLSVNLLHNDAAEAKLVDADEFEEPVIKIEQVNKIEDQDEGITNEVKKWPQLLLEETKDPLFLQLVEYLNFLRILLKETKQQLDYVEYFYQCLGYVFFAICVCIEVVSLLFQVNLTYHRIRPGRRGGEEASILW